MRTLINNIQKEFYNINIGYNIDAGYQNDFNDYFNKFNDPFINDNIYQYNTV